MSNRFDYLATVLHNLRPGAQFAFYDEDYDRILWLEPPVADGGQTMPTLQEVQEEHERVAAAAPMTTLRYDRDIKLKESDWSQGADVPDALKSAWATYRQELRDLPANSTPGFDPETGKLTGVTWPTPPA